jgi:hypothetical protein
MLVHHTNINKMRFWFVLALASFLTQDGYCLYKDAVISAEQSLYKMLFSNDRYLNMLRPSDLVNLNFTLIFKKIINIDERNQQMKSSSNIIA